VDEKKLMALEEAEYLTKVSNMDNGQLKPEEDYFEGEVHKFNKFVIENDKIVPPQVEDQFWAFMDREMALSNLDKDDIKRGLLWFDIAKIDLMMNMPDYKLDFDTIRRIDQARFKAFVKMKRSFGGPDRERALLATQIKDFRFPGQQRKEGNIFSRWFGGGSR
jgi:hypothetical protein